MAPTSTSQYVQPQHYIIANHCRRRSAVINRLMAAKPGHSVPRVNS